jgi:hypothetical protein
MFLDYVYEISLLGVLDRAIPNMERITLKTGEAPLNLAQYGILIGNMNASGQATPYQDNFFWFGEMQVEPHTWIFVYTGPGIFRVTKEQITNETALVFHWGRKNVLFTRPEWVPILSRMDAVLVNKTPDLLTLSAPSK